jgi:hypothetical protein
MKISCDNVFSRARMFQGCKLKSTSRMLSILKLAFFLKNFTGIQLLFRMD